MRVFLGWLVLTLGIGLSAGLMADSAPASAPAALSPAAAAAAMAAPAPATPAAAALVTPMPTPLSTPLALTVSLKDGQTADLSLHSFDRFYLSADNSIGTRFNLPWAEVATLDSPNAAADLGPLRANITAEPTNVTSVIQARRPIKAFYRALWPGFVVHGSGYNYAGDKASFYDLAGGEVFGVALAAFGGYQLAYPNSADTNRSASQSLLIAGGALFAVTWLWDLAFSHQAAASFDDRHGLALLPAAQGGATGAQLAYRF
ncbi:MAG TPA: hypothetical protein VK914_02650 [bacterium]|jgi:hypothetical protein|nr:hypothetical protein [bacterium]